MAKRRATVPLVKGEVPFIRLKPDQLNWTTLERAFGQSLSPGQRQRMFEATQTYAAFRAREMISVPLRGSVHRIKLLKKSAESFGKFLECDRDSMADVFADHEIKLQFSDDYMVAPDSLAGFRHVVGSFVRACEIAISNMAEPLPFCPDGTAWRNWVIELTRIARESGLPASVRTDTDKNKGEPSAFVKFVEKFQAQLPSELQHKRLSVGALAKAINRARHRRDKSNATSKAEKSRSK
jgi:hypothetical protein